MKDIYEHIAPLYLTRHTQCILVNALRKGGGHIRLSQEKLFKSKNSIFA